MMNPFFSNSWGMFGLGVGAFTLGAILFFLLAIAVVLLKGYSLWHAARRSEKGWFIALLLINTMGILELFYLYVVVGKWKTPKVKVEEKKDEVNTGNNQSSN